MTDLSTYSAIELLHGQRYEIRAIRKSDGAGLVEAFGHASMKTIHRRFFSMRRGLTEGEIQFLSNVDFVNHVALVATVERQGAQEIVGGGRYIVVKPGRAEVAFTVVDEHQGRGLGSALLRHIIAIARAAGLEELIAEVLPENAPMLKVFRKSGLVAGTKSGRGVVHVTMRLPARAMAG